ncbi:MAG: diguanylate cyclase, partial [Mesorhizobium sp.]
MRPDRHAVLALLAVGFFCFAAAVSILLSRLDVSAEALKLYLRISIAIAGGAVFLLVLFIRRIMDDRRQIAESEQRFRRAMEDSAIGVAIVGL